METIFLIGYACLIIYVCFNIEIHNFFRTKCPYCGEVMVEEPPLKYNRVWKCVFCLKKFVQL